MKRLVLMLLTVFTVCGSVWAQQGEKSIGVNLGYGSGSLHKSFKIGAEFRYGITDAIRVAPSFDYFFKSDDVGLWSASVNGHYLFGIKSVEGLKVYPLLGLTLLGSTGTGNGEIDMNGEDWSDIPGYEDYIDEVEDAGSSSTMFGCNLGVGIQYPILPNIDLGFEIKYQFVKDYDQVVLGINAAYKF